MRLCNANTPVRFLADWPIAKTKFYIALMNAVTHTEDPNSSQIGIRTNRSAGFTVADRIDILTFRYYFKNKNSFKHFIDFFEILWVPRLKNKLNSLIFNILFNSGAIR